MDSLYSFTLEQEILDEIGASVLASFYRYMNKHNISIEKKDLIAVMSLNIANSKHGIMKCKTMEELSFIRGQFKLAENCLKILDTDE